MGKLALALSAVVVLPGSITTGVAQDRDRTGSSITPGHRMQERGRVPGPPGASGYALGHRDRDDTGTLRDRDDRGINLDRDRQ